MLHTVYSNSYDVLKAVLVFQVLKDMRERAKRRQGEDEASWLRRVFEACEVIVPSRAVELDVHRSICRAGNGVSMTVKTSTSLNWETTLTHLQGARSRDIERLTWDIYERLTASGFLGSVDSLKDFIAHCDADSVHRYDAARHIAGLFSKYLAYRTDWLYLWENGSKEDSRLAAFRKDDTACWQMRLWKDIQTRGHRSESGGLSATRLFFNYRSLCERGQGRDPSPLYLFMPAQFPSIMPPFIARIAKERDLWVFVNNPCLTDWFSRSGSIDCGPVQHYLDTNAGALKALVLRLFALGQRESAPAPEAGAFMQAVGFDDEALEAKDLRYWKGSWSGYYGRSGCVGPAGDSAEPPEHASVCWYERSSATIRDFAMNDEAAFPRESIEEYLRQEKGTPGALGALQQAICENDDVLLPESIDPEDTSIRVVLAPDETRELEAVVDVLDDLLRTYCPDDILVAFPDVSEKSALIEGVFARRNADCNRERIPIRIEGEPLVRSNLAAQAFLDAGRLILGSCSAASVEAWIELPTVLEALSMDLDELRIARDWLVRAGFSMGLSKAHCLSLGFKTDNEASLEDALLRLSLGWAVDPRYASLLSCHDAQGSTTRCCPIDSIQRGDFNGVDAHPELLLKLMTLFRTLEDARLEIVGRRQRMSLWGEWTLTWFDRLFAKGDVDTLARVRSILVATASSDAQAEIDFELFWHVLASRFNDERTGGAQRQAVTFASICDVHAVSRKVVVAAGLSGRSRFPGNQVFGEFDLMHAARHPELPHNRRRSDRDSRIDNRNDFFELMLCAKERFYMIYCVGSKPKHAEEPSVVVKDLLDLLTARARESDLRTGSEKVASMLAAITERVPLSAVSPAVFTGQTGVLPSFDIALAKTLRAQQKNASLDEDVLFPTGSFDAAYFLGSRRFTVDSKTLASFLYDPDGWLLQASGIHGAWEEVRLEPNLTEDADSRVQYKERKEAFEQLCERFETLSSENLKIADASRLEDIVSVMRSDPKYGIRSYREQTRFPEEIWSAYVRYRNGTEGGVARTLSCSFDLTVSDSKQPKIELKELDIPLYRGSDGVLRAVCLCHSGRDLMRAAVLGLLLKVCSGKEGEPYETLVVSTRFEEAEQPLVRMADLDCAKRLLHVALSLYAETACRDGTLRPGVVPTLERGTMKPGQAATVPPGCLWRGLSNAELRTLYAAAKELDWYRLVAMPAGESGHQEAPSIVVSRFESAAKELLLRHDPETPYRIPDPQEKAR